ncbi:hypothetical protein CRE_21815 [Caenorhabditis remanei]|uniref:SCP domain-containing protein n=1 Tax=Caenorhabditis remanei TaxID=31234 RepID=E3MEM1_CAERE|nr:hypothetical protein CRE_21815 [Caenorhabditis remanei]
MKILYIICILFAFFAQSVVSTSKDYEKVNVDYLNRARNQFAANLPVANMNELEYDVALEKTFSSCQTAQKEAENDNRVIMFRSDSVTEISFDREGEAQKLVNDNHVNALLYKLIFHSQITSVGCVQLDMECAYPGPGQIRLTYGEPRACVSSTDLKMQKYQITSKEENQRHNVQMEGLRSTKTCAKRRNLLLVHSFLQLTFSLQLSSL